MGWALYPDGTLQIFRVASGDILEERQLFEGTTVTAASFTTGRPDVAFGFEDGTVVVGKIRFEPTFREMADMPEQYREMKRDDEAVFEKGVVKRTPIGQYRLQRVVTELFPAVEVAGARVSLIDHIAPTKDEERQGKKDVRVVYYSADGKLTYCVLAPKENMFTGDITVSATKQAPLPYEPRDGGDSPDYLLYSAGGSSTYLAWKDGLVRHFDTRRPDSATLVEEVDVVAEPDATLNVFHHLIGRETIMCGDSAGGLRAWFLVRDKVVESDAQQPEGPEGEDAGDNGDGVVGGVVEAGAGADIEESAGGGVSGEKKTRKQQNFKLVMAHDLHRGDGAVTCVGGSERSRMIAVGYDKGGIRVYHVTADHLVLETEMKGADPVTQVIITPKDDGLIAAVPGRMVCWDFDPKHPEATWASLFWPVWYEGYSEPIHMWQSSFAGVESEMKLGLYPLIFGTIKATFYSMLFGAPLALLAAIYTSEFLAPVVRSKVKPTIEVMASLPSVVLGFLAALVFAPVVETMVPAVLSAMLVIPATLMIGAFLWQLLPRYVELIMNRYGMRLVFIFVALTVGTWLSFLLGPIIERLFFAGNVMRWLDDRSVGDGTGAWMFLLLPASTLVTVALIGAYVNPWLRLNAAGSPRFLFGLLNLLKLAAAFVFTVAIAWGVSWILTKVGWDPRGSYIATYGQRNAMVVGFAMGFAIIPIIYTIAEDALSTVPKHLRSASLGAGATPWQTATRIVIPTAMSGLFSALMVGLGRAVGETMIVLMAAGNTPVMDWNVFNGFRTLSANIAVELPEAVRNSTHYRTLFLAALTLFVMTFVVNTIAERVRVRFRRRAYQL
jgi:phosphate transport system permease protein